MGSITSTEFNHNSQIIKRSFIGLWSYLVPVSSSMEFGNMLSNFTTDVPGKSETMGVHPAVVVKWQSLDGAFLRYTGLD